MKAAPAHPCQRPAQPSKNSVLHGRRLFRLASPLLSLGLLLAAVVPATGLRAQSTYATPYTFTTLAGQVGTVGYADGTGTAALFSTPSGLAVDSGGNLYVADFANWTIRKITSAGVVSTLAGTPVALLPPNSPSHGVDGTGSAATFPGPFGVAVDSAGNVYVAEDDGLIREVTPAGVVTTIAGSLQSNNGDTGNQNGPADTVQFRNPQGIAVDASGNVYIADTGNDTICRLTPGGLVTTLAGFGMQYGFTDGTGTQARFNSPEALAVDGSGNVYVADTGNETIRKITSAGVVTTLAGTPGVSGSADGTGGAATFYPPTAIAIDAAGNLYVATSNNTVRRITSAGVVTTLAGTPGTAGSADGTGAQALFKAPAGVAVDSGGDLFVADTDNDTIRERYAAAFSAPTIATQPTSASVAIGASATFSVVASGVPDLDYQWLLNGAFLSGATNASLTLADVQAANLGTYSVLVTNSAGSATSAAVTLSSPGVSAPAVPAAARLVNISSRAYAGAGASVEIAGFVVTGQPGNTEQVLVRGVGPALGAFGVGGELTQTVLTLFDSTGKQIASNSGWGTSPNAVQIAAAASATGAFALAQGSGDSALLVNLAPGAYTAQVSGAGGTLGVALAEVYEVSSSNTQLVDISTRAFVGTGSDVEIAGIVVKGSRPATVLVRAVGPTLGQFGVTGALAQPSLSVTNSSGTIVATNTGWSTNSNSAAIVSAASAVGAFALPSGSADCALLLALQPGSYTAVVSGVGSTTGIALAEAYQVP